MIFNNIRVFNITTPPYLHSALVNLLWLCYNHFKGADYIMKYKLPSNRQQIKFLKKLLNTNTSYNGGFLLDKTFYLLFKLSKSEVTQILNALEDKKLIKIIPPSPINSLPWIKIEQKAFSYIPDLRDNLFRFWIPIVISSGISIAAIIVSILALLLSLQSLTQ